MIASDLLKSAIIFLFLLRHSLHLPHHLDGDLVSGVQSLQHVAGDLLVGVPPVEHLGSICQAQPSPLLQRFLRCQIVEVKLVQYRSIYFAGPKQTYLLVE